MTVRLTQALIGKRVLQNRKLKGLSQEDLARFLKIPRSSVAQIELGNRSLSVVELITLSEVLGFSIDKFLCRNYENENENEMFFFTEAEEAEYGTRFPKPELKPEKLKNILLYVLEQCAGKPNVGETVLYKLLYFADFNYYETYEEHLSGSEYRKLDFGPVPQNIDGIIREMISRKMIKRIKTDYHGYPQTRYIPLEKADLKSMNAAEKEIIDKVIDRFSDWSASALSDYSHKDMP